jgi:hypothetical protein
MDEPNEKTGFEVAQEVRIRRVIQGVVTQIRGDRPDLSDEEVLALAEERIAADPALMRELVAAELGLRGVEVAREMGLAPDDPDRGDSWRRPEGTDRR